MLRNLAVGHFYNEPFIDTCTPWTDRIAEVFFAWPGVLSCRPAPENTPELRARLLADLRWCREQGIRLDTLFNCNCYGDLSISHELATQVRDVLKDMQSEGLFPDIVTTTSPFVATILKQEFPQVRVRASVNVRIQGILGFQAVAELFDEYYLNREHQRDLAYVKTVAAWAARQGKALGMQVNSGCLRDCPFQTFHDNLHGHGRQRQSAIGKDFDFSVFRCRTHYGRDKQLIDILRATWIRPEDVPLWEPHVQLFKLATRRIGHPSAIVKAYATYNYDGNLLELLDPQHTDLFAPGIINNQSFPPDWATSGIGAACALNCQNCGRCQDVFRKVFRDAQDNTLPAAPNMTY